MILAASPLDGGHWAFHLVNDSDQPITSVLLESVDYEWGDMGSERKIGSRFGPIAARTAVEIWRDDDDAAELRMSLYLVVDGRRVMAEFPKLYKVRTFERIPILEIDGYRGTTSGR